MPKYLRVHATLLIYVELYFIAFFQMHALIKSFP